MELIIFSGLQGSGKRPYYHEHFAATHVHVSKDRFREGRERDPGVAIHDTSKKLVAPSVDEGFDEVRVVVIPPVS